MKKKLLWIEDDALLGSILSKALESTNFELTHVKDAKLAMDYLRNNVPDIIMVDIMMPGEMNGYDVLKAISIDERFNKVPRLVLSNLSKPSDIERAKSLGVTKFIVKADSSLEQIIKELGNQVSDK